MDQLVLWATDVHLDHLPLREAALEFGRALSREQPDAVSLIVTGDIAEAHSVEGILRDLVAGFGRPVYFVLGNHDYYGASFNAVDRAVTAACRTTPGLYWLRHEVVPLTDAVTLIGLDGWYDAGYGDRNSDLQLSDFVLIEELFAAQDDSRAELLRTCAERARSQAHALELRLAQLAEHQSPRHVVVATHVPPFQEAAWHEGKPSDDRWAPFFSNRALGETLLRWADREPQIATTVLCGHTHGSGCYRPRDNLTVYTGRAQYGAPDLAGFVDVGSDRLGVRLC
ncbi:MAG TPA: metallophosphoesterase [Polyangiaceae bacterium]